MGVSPLTILRFKGKRTQKSTSRAVTESGKWEKHIEYSLGGGRGGGGGVLEMEKGVGGGNAHSARFD